MFKQATISELKKVQTVVNPPKSITNGLIENVGNFNSMSWADCAS